MPSYSCPYTITIVRILPATPSVMAAEINTCYYVDTFSGGVGGPAGPALAGALFDGVMNINN